MRLRRFVAGLVLGLLAGLTLTSWAAPRLSGGGVSGFGLSPFCLDAANQDVCLARTAADSLALRRSTNAQTLRVYHSFTDSSNGDWLEFFTTGSAQVFRTGSNGAGSSRNLVIGAGNTNYWEIDSGQGHFVAVTDNANDIGASGSGRPRGVYAGTSVTSPTYLTTTRCANTGSPAVCAAAPAGSVVIAAAATAVVVNTTAVTANSQVFAMIDRSLGTLLSVTCDTTSDLTTGSPAITARTAGTSFTIAVPIAPAANPMCLSYFIVN